MIQRGLLPVVFINEFYQLIFQMVAIIVYALKFIQWIYPSSGRSIHYYDKLSQKISFNPDRAGGKVSWRKYLGTK